MEIQAATVSVLVLFLMLAMSVPVSFSIILASLLTIIMFPIPGFGMLVSVQKIVSSTDSFTLLVVPFFVLARLLMSSGDTTKRLINLAMPFLGEAPGSLAMTSITGNVMFGSISDSGIAVATVIGGVMPSLEEEQGYGKGLLAAVNITTAPMGQLIPPTAPFIVYSTASGGVPVTALLMAGWVPGLLWAALCTAVACVYSTKYEYVTRRDKVSAAIIVKTIWGAIPSLLLIVIIIGGILSSYSTPTGALGVAVMYAFLLPVFVYKSIQIKDIPKVLVDTAVMTIIVMLVIDASPVLSFVLSFTGLSQAISSLLLGIPDNRIVTLLIINITLLIVGTFMGVTPTLLIFTPIFPPVVKSLGMDPIQFGIMIAMNLSTGTIMSLAENALFMGCSVARLQVEDVIKKLPPFSAAIVVALMFITFVSGFSMWLPGVLGLLK